MKPTQTGIAVAVALVVIVFFFVFNGMSIFSGLTTTTETTTNQTASTIMSDVTELQMTDEIIGTGTVAAAGDTVTVQYVGTLTDGTVFDASEKHSADGFTFNLGAGQVIKGWDQGVAGMKEGGKRKLVIPASLAYGDHAVGNIIPANSTLIFEVELLKVQK
ncbi:MAG: FKBP-type peptidyl-prolyl cis-trans isomerase [Candidatus Paceibacterota bacterium]|jgi:FKBP-type peptidyl-prolyl cis-trans isomerase